VVLPIAALSVVAPSALTAFASFNLSYCCQYEWAEISDKACVWQYRNHGKSVFTNPSVGHIVWAMQQTCTF
jgi:hypothetical protein